MKRAKAPILLAGLLLLGLAAPPPAPADETGDRITWIRNLADAFAAAKEQDRPLMICINSERVDGGRREPAAKELRERTYLDASIVTLSRQFVCAFLTAEGSSEDFGELRLRYGIDGEIVSPQHIFAYPDGTLISRKEYWPYGRGEGSVSALTDLMQKALAADRTRRGLPGTPPDEGEDGEAEDVPAMPETPEAPDDPVELAAWIEAQLEVARRGDPLRRQAALRGMVRANEGESTLAALLELLDEWKKEPVLLVDLIRALGMPGLDAAADPLTDFLKHRDASVRANAAVSLEYIGCSDAVSALMKYAKKEDDPAIANHMYRALGRCGAGQAKVRTLLVKMVQGADSNEAAYGPIIGLAYFGQDARTAREVEKLLKKEGMPGGRGGWRGGAKRALLVWCLTEVGFGDPKAAKFVREDMIPIVAANAWTAEFVDFYVAAAECCEGSEEAKEEVDAGTRFAVGFGRGRAREALMDDARRDREGTDFEPKGDALAGGGGR